MRRDMSGTLMVGSTTWRTSDMSLYRPQIHQDFDLQTALQRYINSSAKIYRLRIIYKYIYIYIEREREGEIDI